MVDLGTLGGTRSYAYGVNNAGQVVGQAYPATGTNSGDAVIWSGPWQDLAVDFGPGVGLWALRQTSWLQIHGLAPGRPSAAISTATDSIIWSWISGQPRASGSWMNHAKWLPLHNLSPDHMVVGNFDGNGKDNVVLDFPGYGLWMWKNMTSWVLVNSLGASTLAVGNLDGNGRMI